MGHGGKVNLYRLFQSFISIRLALSLYDYTHIATDITGNNVAFTCSNLSTVTKKALFEVLGPPELEQVTRCDGMPLEDSVPEYLVESARWDDWVDEDKEDIRITDIGQSFLQGAEPKILISPGHLRVPEAVFGDTFDHRVDLWHAGCVVGLPTYFAEN
jgi:serine/threonine-protein kinase SRPK3